MEKHLKANMKSFYEEDDILQNLRILDKDGKPQPLNAAVFSRLVERNEQALVKTVFQETDEDYLQRELFRIKLNHRAEYAIKHPQTGEEIVIPESDILSVRLGSKFTAALREHNANKYPPQQA